MDHNIDPAVLMDIPPPAPPSALPVKRSATIAPSPEPSLCSTKPPPKKKSAPKKARKKAKSNEDDDNNNIESKSPPHIWTNDQRSALLELIATEFAAGKQTDNGGLKKEAWPGVVKKLNEKLGTNLTGNQCRNQKNTLRRLFIDLKFLRGQSGFGWDEECKTVTADEKDKPFPLYDLALSVFDGTAATGGTAGAHLPP
ncbi:hypothetical protein PTTG_07122 [Puccinia triticina 1-1 BBBD Race 1]|uniref:Myb_DNA-bind_3 domain-containing protein n=1 Tax=Puccinia triticina (isolate 1-1 / race 1 (BBBD)) TaxID=630390 RepID=A0A180FZE5_PUCT1|nr:hypothetical protein PTTG_07122 [Puccinia triticina 1-1 BBBD Race 1]